MTWSLATRALVIGLPVLVGLYDLAAYTQAGSPATISRTVWRWAERYPLLPLAVGVLIGHLFAPQHVRD